MRIQSIARLAILLGLILGACGCTSLGVKPWQREILARPEMALNASARTHASDPQRMEADSPNHLISRAAAKAPPR